MSKDTSKLEEIRKALGLDGYGAKCTGLDCSHEIGVDHYIITDVHLADLLAWHREEVALARADEIAQIISDGIFPEKYLLDREAAHRKQATNKSKEVER